MKWADPEAEVEMSRTMIMMLLCRNKRLCRCPHRPLTAVNRQALCRQSATKLGYMGKYCAVVIPYIYLNCARCGLNNLDSTAVGVPMAITGLRLRRRPQAAGRQWKWRCPALPNI